MNLMVFLLISLLVLSGCATTTRTASAPSERVKAEEQFHRELAVRASYDLETRLDSVGNRVLHSAVASCRDNISYGIGMYSGNSFMYGKNKEAAEKVLAPFVDEYVRVNHVMPGLAGDKASFKRGDIILSVNGIEIPNGKNGPDVVAKAFGEIKADSVYEIVHERDGKKLKTTLRPQPKCGYVLVLGPGNEVNAYADGNRIIVSRGMMMFASDDLELSFVIAHELAHNVMNHVDAKAANSIFGSVLDVIVSASTGVGTQGMFEQIGARAFSQDFEREADYVGLYILTNAGADIEKVPAFWRRMAALNPGSITSNHAATHPATPERFVAMEETIREIRAKQEAGKPLVPEMK